MLDQKGYKCYLPIRRRFASMDAIFHEVVPFFLLANLIFKEETCVGEDVLTLPLPVPIFVFYVEGGHHKGEKAPMDVQKNSSICQGEKEQVAA